MLTPEKLRQMNANYDRNKKQHIINMREEMEWRAITAGTCMVNDMPPRRLMGKPETSTNNHAPVYSQRVVAALADAPRGIGEYRL